MPKELHKRVCYKIGQRLMNYTIRRGILDAWVLIVIVNWSVHVPVEGESCHNIMNTIDQHKTKTSCQH